MPPLHESGERPHTQVDSGPVFEKKRPDLGFFYFLCLQMAQMIRVPEALWKRDANICRAKCARWRSVLREPLSQGVAAKVTESDV